MKNPFLFIFLLFVAGPAIAQNHDSTEVNVHQQITHGIRISGIVKDSVLDLPLEYSSLLLQRTDRQQGEGINSDSVGYFEFTNVPSGSYILNIYYVGYDKLALPVIVDSSSTNIDMGIINMSAKAATLREVNIVDYKQLIEQRPDGLVYNAEKDITSKGTTAEQLLRKVPMLTVDLEGNVQMRGNGNIRVLIDGRPSTIIAASVKDALKQIPSDNIKSVEVITSPGAKYDGEGAAGVINIITKKSLIKGISGNINGQFSYNAPREFFTGNGGFNLNYRNKNLGVSMNAGYGSWQMYQESDTRRVDFPGEQRESRLSQQSSLAMRGNYFWSNLSADYQIDSLQTVQAGISYNPSQRDQDMTMHTRFMPLQPGAPDFQRTNHSTSPTGNVGLNASYSRKFKNNPLRTLDILSQYSVNATTSEYELYSKPEATDVVNYREKNTNDSRNKEFTIQADYVQPLKHKGQKIETGLKFINRDIHSSYQLKYWTIGEDDYVIDPKRTNSLDYVQQVGAAYGQFSTNLFAQLSMVAGLRYEFTNIDGRQEEENSKFNSQFNNLLPNLSFSYQMKNYSRVKLAYNQRIERPSIFYVNPYINYSDQYNISQGNPMLVPERTHNIELGYSTFFKNTSLNFSSFYRHTGNAIERITEVGDDNISRTTFENIAKNNIIGLDFFGNTNIWGRWMINLNGSVYYKMLKSPSLNISNSGWQYSTNIYTSFKLSERFSIAGFGMYNAAQVQLQGSQTGWFYYNLGLQTTFLKGKATITLSGENFFHPIVKLKTHYQYQNADYTTEANYYGRGVRLAFNWSFGKMNFIQKKGIKNDDLKSGSSGQQGMGGQ